MGSVLDGLHTAVRWTRQRTVRERVLPPQAELIAAHVAALRRLDDRHGGGALSLRYVVSELRGVLDLVRCADYERAVGRQLLTTVADLAQLVGWMQFDASRYGPAERYLLLSIRIGRALEESGRVANAIGMLAYISAFAGHGIEAIRIVEAASRVCPSRMPVLQARIAGREATAAAAAGDLSGFRASSEQARELLAQNRQAEAPTYLYYLEPEQLVAEAGQALVVLAEQDTAHQKRLLSEAAELLGPVSVPGARPDYPRSALLHGAFLAKAHLMAGDLESAIATTRAALHCLAEVQSFRGRNYLGKLRPAFARRKRSPLVADFLPEFDEAVSNA
jgi:hypothetical protein